MSRPRRTSSPYRSKTEEQYALSVLAPLQKSGEILTYYYEAVHLRLASDTFYIPDFLVVYPDRFEFHEVKGWWRRAGRIKIKEAAELYPYFHFLSVQKMKEGWAYEVFAPHGGVYITQANEPKTREKKGRRKN